MEPFDPSPDATAVDTDEQAWREAEAGLDARHQAGTNGHCQPKLPPERIVLEIELLPAIVASGYAPRIVHELVLDTTPQRVSLKLVTATLEAQKATLADGTPVRRPQTALQWLLEQFAVRLRQQTLDELMAGAM